MAKHLRIDIAELTDIGRRRSNNQDNVGTRVPQDQHEMDRTGALFVVADGMGGHAAGEIASTVAVQTITSVFEDLLKDDVMDALDLAVRKANEAVYTVSRENADHMGMGTTVVAAVINQGLLYVANIGDSRAYMIRDGEMRQLTNDHSWVAEQVRAGVLTEEQARSHVHRNVITRSLGTQPEVTPDIFIETLQEGDIIILCSDGLHGYVEDTQIKEIVATHPPKVAAERLIAAANEAGGPDNITVAIAKVQETPIPSHTVLELAQKTERQRRETTPLILPPPTVKIESVAVLETPIVAIASSSTEKKRTRRGRVLTLTIVALLLIAAVSGVILYTLAPFTQKTYVSKQVTDDLAKVNSDLNMSGTSTLTPRAKLVQLGQDQQKLLEDLKLPNLSTTQKDQLLAALDKITPVAQTLLKQYNQLAEILPIQQTPDLKEYALQCPSNIQAPLVAVAPGAVSAGSVASAPLYIRDGQGHVYPITLGDKGKATCGTAIGTDQMIIDMVADGNHLDVLYQPITNGTPQPPVIGILSTDGKPIQPLVTLTQFDMSYVPTHLAIAPNGGTLAVLARPRQGNTSDNLYIISGATYDKISPAITCWSNITAHIRSFALGNNNLVYLLLDNGAMATCGQDGTHYHPIQNTSEVQPVIADPQTFTIQTPLPVSSRGDRLPLNGPNLPAPLTPDPGTPTPTPTPTPAPTATPTERLQGVPLFLPSAQTISLGLGSNLPRIAIADSIGKRIVVMASNGGTDLDLIRQYTDQQDLNALIGMVIAPDGQTLFLLNPTKILTIPIAPKA